jgi:ABC-type enterochelin transport system permease subunit
MSDVYFVFSVAVVVLHFALGASFVQSSDRDRMKTPKAIGFNLVFFLPQYETDFIFQSDNAKQHTVHVSLAFLQQNIDAMP